MLCPMTTPDVQSAVAQSFLHGLPHAFVDQLLMSGTCVDVPKGTTIYRPGDDPWAVLVVHGLLRVYMSSPEGGHVTVRYTRTGDVLRIPVLVGGPVYVGVSTLADSRLFRLDGRLLITTARRDAAVAWALAEVGPRGRRPSAARLPRRRPGSHGAGRRAHPRSRCAP